ncbi:TPA: HTH domain-containing protein [Staphylococcus aureus]|uniref:HTH domain-containing protein n=1 Tax=Mammaliicoccus sciuri TaxID=1296 RepID=UPI001C4E59DA|nr:HTH domain-containing protein [Mammaliicoccus sciuri]HDJ6669642.1 HTH domain-containing protein [Staphylococcus aureus]HDJ6670264.1 HTH domain-containing protein [Staphylococcus aureus]
MDRSHRLLTIYTRLLQNKYVNKYELTKELNSSSRTIQRDIDQIRNYLYETDDWYGHKKNVIYNYKNESYSLENIQTINNNALFYILAVLLTINNEINDELYQYLKHMISTFHSDYKTELLKLIDKKHIEQDELLFFNLSAIGKALYMKKTIHLKELDIIVSPITLKYEMGSFYLIYQYKDQHHKLNIEHEILEMKSKTMAPINPLEQLESITVEIDKSVWVFIRKNYPIDLIEKYAKDKLIVKMKMSYDDALNLSFIYRSKIRIISPDNLKNSIITELLMLNETYLRQSINNY